MQSGSPQVGAAGEILNFFPSYLDGRMDYDPQYRKQILEYHNDAHMWGFEFLIWSSYAYSRGGQSSLTGWEVSIKMNFDANFEWAITCE